MTHFDELNEYLAGEFTADYWYDEASEEAQEIVKEFRPEDWDRLGREWRQRSPEWQSRCAYALHGANSRQAAPILREMLLSSDQKVALTSVDALLTLDLESVEFELKGPEIDRLQAIEANRPDYTDVVQELLARVSPTRPQ
jgi:hypothetical protein